MSTIKVTFEERLYGSLDSTYRNLASDVSTRCSGCPQGMELRFRRFDQMLFLHLQSSTEKCPYILIYVNATGVPYHESFFIYRAQLRNVPTFSSTSTLREYRIIFLHPQSSTEKCPYILIYVNATGVPYNLSSSTELN